jgi:hypothetical protein
MQYPLEFRFKLLALSSQIYVRDSNGALVGYVKQKAFKLKEAVSVFADEAQTRLLFTISADRWLDFSARYRIADAEGRELGVIQRRGMRSIWRAHYEVERDGRPVFTIQEVNPWVKVADGIISNLPFIGLASGYILHPAYKVVHVGRGLETMRLSKQSAFFEGRFRFERRVAMEQGDEQLALLSALMMVLLERVRG